MVEIQAPTEAELRAFVGPRGDKYWRKWRWYLNRNRWTAGTLWPPIFFDFIWFFYRRMYREVWILFLFDAIVLSAIWLFVGFLEAQNRWPVAVPKEIARLVDFGFAFATSWLGSLLYLRKFRRAVVEARRTTSTPEAALESLRLAGGTSRLGAGIGVALWLALWIAVGVVAILLEA